MSTLYIVATPIGNLQDITLRALETLKKVDYIACEDTRQTQKLLQHFHIQKPLLACHEHNEKNSSEGIIKLLNQGHDIAYCSDAGTPSLSDPGAWLVASCVKAQHQVVPLPGVSAFATLISVAGIRMHAVQFAGFLPPHGGKRTKRLQALLHADVPFIVYESPHRISKLIEEIAHHCPLAFLVVGREMTKLHEEFWYSTAQDLLNDLPHKKLLGEFAILVQTNC